MDFKKGGIHLNKTPYYAYTGAVSLLITITLFRQQQRTVGYILLILKGIQLVHTCLMNLQHQLRNFQEHKISYMSSLVRKPRKTTL